MNGMQWTKRVLVAGAACATAMLAAQNVAAQGEGGAGVTFYKDIAPISVQPPSRALIRITSCPGGAPTGSTV